MRHTHILTELKKALQPYLFFWEEWAANDLCNLSPGEVNLVNVQLKKNFKLSLPALLMFYKQADALKTITRKLHLGYQVFKDFVIVRFMHTIMTLAKNYADGYDAFMYTPIKLLRLAENLKDALLGFGSYSLHLLFMSYKADDFGRGWLYQRLVVFQVFYKKQAASTY